MVERDIRDYLQDILTHIDFAEEFVEGMSFNDFQNDNKTILALTRALEIIGEATKKIPPSLRDQYPEIVWQEVTGMRDKLAHDYFGVELNIVWNTTREDLPQLKPVVQSMLNRLVASDSDG